MSGAVDSATRDDYTQLDSITEETRNLSNKIRDEIRVIDRTRVSQSQIERNRVRRYTLCCGVTHI